MTRLRYPFAEIGLRCRLCNLTQYMDTSGGRVGAHDRLAAPACEGLPRLAWLGGPKGLALDQHGALLYPGEVGPFVPRAARANGSSAEPDLLDLPNKAFDQASLL